MANNCNFTTDLPPGTVIDPHKRVRHFTGLVMGEEEFRQDQLYFMTRDELHQRALHGYGVVSGLDVSMQPDAATGNPKVVVAAGMAVDPRGESICVPQAQCGDLNEWLENNRDELLGSPPTLLPGSVTLYLVLCARDCETDAVPVLGDPCRTLEDATAASRIADDFQICLRLEPPQQLEEEAVRELGELLRSIEISDVGESLSPEELADVVRDIRPSGSPPQVGTVDAGAGSPPVVLRLHPDDMSAALAEVYRVWIQEVRPTLNPETGACEIPRDADDGRCVLLACLEVAYDDGTEGLEVSGDVGIDSSCGPVLVQTRVLQEMLLGGPCCSAASPALGSPATDGAPDAGSSPPAVGPVSHSDLLDLDADDHDQYLLVDPATRALVTDLPADGNLITGLGESGVPAGDEAVRWDRAVKNGDAAGGDLSGTYPNPQVDALQGNPVAPGALGATDTGSILVWDGVAWRLGMLPFERALTRIIALSWRHSEQTLLQIIHDRDRDPVFGLVVGFGTGVGAQAPVEASTLNNDTFRVFLRVESTLDTALPSFQIVELRPRAVLPVNVVLPASGLIVETRSPAIAAEVNGVLFQIDEEAATRLRLQRQQLFIELAGDHIRDAGGRAIDAEFPRSELPSGDGPGTEELGIQGGRFESWVTARFPIIIDGRDLNSAGVNELTGLPGIGSILARRIVDFREERDGFESFDDLAIVPGVTNTLLNNLRALLET